MNQIDLNNKTAVITGGAQGFGYSMVERFSQSGAKVVIWDKDQELIDSLDLPDNVSAVQTDVTSYDSIENSLNETINFMKIANSLNFKKFLIMPPAYYKYEDKDVLNFYSRVVDAIPECQIILYNFEKLCGYKFSIECVKELVKRFPNQIVGVKDSSYNLFENLKLDNFSVMPGSESKLLKGLELGCSGIITATCNATAVLARKVYDDFYSGKKQTVNQKLCDVRSAFENYNLISGLHSFYSKENKIYKNISKWKWNNRQ